MDEKTPKEKKELDWTVIIKTISGLLVALASLTGAYLAYLRSYTNIVIPVSATQTAESRLTIEPIATISPPPTEYVVAPSAIPTEASLQVTAIPSLEADIKIASIIDPDGSSIDLLQLTSENKIQIYGCYGWEPEITISIEFSEPPDLYYSESRLHWILTKANSPKEEGYIKDKNDIADEKEYAFSGTISLADMLSGTDTQTLELEMYIEALSRIDNSWKRKLLDEPIKLEIVCIHQKGD